MIGLIVKGIGGFYTVRTDDGLCFTLKARGKLRKEKKIPTVGDKVLFTPGDDEHEGSLDDILPRVNFMNRPPVSNIDLIVVVIASAAPPPDMMLVDKLLIHAEKNDIPSIIVVNKSDDGMAMYEDIYDEYGKAGYEVFATCTIDGSGISELKSMLKGKLFAFAGQSGVGKSTLVNAMYGFELKTGAMSERIDRGKHTTRHAEIIFTDDGSMVMDTPGFSLLEQDLIEPLSLKENYPEFSKFEGQCRFNPCSHSSETDCAVRRAASSGEIGAKRWERYCELFNEMKTMWRDRYD